MELKTTLFAIFLVIMVTWRNNKIANLEGKKYLPYGLTDAVKYIEEIKEKYKMLREKTKNK